SGDSQWSLSPSHMRLSALTLLPERPSLPPSQILRSNHLFRQRQPSNGAQSRPRNLQAVQEGPFSKPAKGLLQTEGLLQPRGGAAIACTVLPVLDYLVEKIFRSLQLIVPTWLTVAQNQDGRRT